MVENSAAQIERDREVDRGCKELCNKEAELMDRGGRNDAVSARV